MSYLASAQHESNESEASDSEEVNSVSPDSAELTREELVAISDAGGDDNIPEDTSMPCVLQRANFTSRNMHAWT